MSNLVFIQEQPIINLSLCEMIRIQGSAIEFCFDQASFYWTFSNSKQALVAYEAIKKSRCTDLGKFDFTSQEVQDIYNRVN